MTENELIDFLEDEISGLKDQRDGVIGEIAAEVFLEINGKERISKLRAIIGLITEIKQYRKLGTVEELKNQKHNLSIAYKIISDYQNIGTVEDLKSMKENGAFSTKELLIIRSQQMELEKYKEIGTVEEVREAVEKTKGKKIIKRSFVIPYEGVDACPVCKKPLGRITKHCRNCGQRLEK